MMTLCATRRTSSLLCTIAILFALMTTSIVSAAGQTYDLVVAINGSTFIYNKMKVATPPLLDTAPFAADLTTALRGYATVSKLSLSVNDSALYVNYTATVSPPHTDVDVLSKVAEAELPATNAALEQAKTAFMASINKNYNKMYPTNVRPFTPLLPPDETTTTPAPVITTILNSTHTLYLTGDESAWRDVLQVAQVSLASAVSDAVVKSLQHNNDKVACKTDGLAVRGADPTLTLPGDGRGGLTARVTVSQFVTAKTQHAYDPLEVNSALSNINVSHIVDAIVAKVPSALLTNVSLVAIRHEMNVDSSLFTKLQLGMIIMGAVILALTVLTFFVFIFIRCCCWRCCGPKPEDDGAVLTRRGASPLHGLMYDTQGHNQADYNEDGSPKYVYYSQS